MNFRKLYLVSFAIMIFALLIMGINGTFYAMSDWVIRIVGIVMMINLVVLVYSLMKFKQKDT
ncbi:MAG: hypothetical protein IBX70_08870 [Clostridia bacterium]|nr:hypothetical protein [Clostridia bacterium]